jgi:hypothetical protein
MPDGYIYEGFEGEETCMCQKSQGEILAYFVAKLPVLKQGERIVISQDCMGYVITIEKVGEEC